MSSLKIIVAGPKGSGKTTVSNFISGHSSDLGNERYEPTAGVRILEFEAPGRNPSETVGVELWDASGDHNYETCWRGIMAESDGVILVYNPDKAGQDQQIGDWFEFFVKKNGLRDDQCIIFAHRGAGNSNDRFRAPPLFQKVTAALTTAQSGQDIRGMFENLVKEIISMKQRK
jgi:Rab-like protein 5